MPRWVRKVRDRWRNAWGGLRYYRRFLRAVYEHDLAWGQIEDHTWLMASQARCETKLQTLLDFQARLAERYEGWQRSATEERQQSDAGRGQLVELIGRLRDENAELRALLLCHARSLGELENRVARLTSAGIPPAFTGAAEIEILRELASVLPRRMAIDVGAHHGTVSHALLDCGYEVVAFEPDPDSFAVLQSRHGSRAGFRAYPWAVAETDGEQPFHRVRAVGEGLEPSLYSGLRQHPLSAGLAYAQTVPVRARSLRGLLAEGIIPADADVLKMDCEGLDARNLLTLDESPFEVVCTEFWADDFVFGPGNAMESATAWARAHGYAWNVILETRDGEESVSYRLNSATGQQRSWGNVFHFRRAEHFRVAAAWCRASLSPSAADEQGASPVAVAVATGHRRPPARAA
jgi:FkbM family methyltransferase